MRFAWLAAHVISASVVVTAAPAHAEDAKDATAQKAPARRAKKAKNENLAMVSFPGFEMLPDGSSRVFVDVSKKADIEEHASPGAVTYVIKDAFVDTPNDTNALETYYWNTPVVRARLRQTKAPAGKKPKHEVDLYIVLRGDVKPTMAQTPQKDGSVRVEVTFPPGNYPTDGAPPQERPAPKKAKDHAGKGAKASKKPGPQP